MKFMAVEKIGLVDIALNDVSFLAEIAWRTREPDAPSTKKIRGLEDEDLVRRTGGAKPFERGHVLWQVEALRREGRLLRMGRLPRGQSASEARLVEELRPAMVG